MITAPAPPSPRIPPFRPRQRRADAPPIPRWNPRAAKFHAIRSRLPSPTSHAACARYRLGRKAAVRHRTLTKCLDAVQKHLSQLHTHILHLLESPTLLPSATMASVIHDVECASSLCCALSAAGPSRTIHRSHSSVPTLLHGRLKLTTPPCVPSSTPADFFRWMIM
ncbi:hypothetical protein MVEN_00160100 [Mycena venus]|uniref:Uncharacterized protein n=1 Tax=Mycena venus TaxID=2733690 RepID=A0A8H7DDR0_9AGAR|nr:hypothetical protein MVEN_00160100 [Mycena venus]